MFGCGEQDGDGGAGEWRGFGQGAAFRARADRLAHGDDLDPDALARAHAGERVSAPTDGRDSALGRWPVAVAGGSAGGRVWEIPSTPETVRLGVFDTTLPDLFEIDSGDELVYRDTWSHFLNRLQPGVAASDLARMRREAAGRGPHSIIGPVGVRDAQPGDVIALQFLTLDPVDWGATFVNPGDLGTGALPDDFPDGQVRYLDLDRAAGTAEFLPGISIPLGPFQGTFATAPAEGGSPSSIPPGPYAGNIDLRDLTVGSILYIPVWQPGARLFTGDSHATQGDGEVNNQALESAMREVRVRVSLHQNAPWRWPIAETADHWITMGIDPDLNGAFRIAVRNTIDFLHRRAGLDPMDAYSLASIAIHFRVTQFVNRSRGVHAMIPKALFAAERRRDIRVV